MQLNWLREISFSKKVAVLKTYLLLKKFFFRKSICSEELPNLRKYMFRIIANSKEVAFPKQWLCWKSTYLQEVADQKKYLLPMRGY